MRRNAQKLVEKQVGIGKLKQSGSEAWLVVQVLVEKEKWNEEDGHLHEGSLAMNAASIKFVKLSEHLSAQQ